MMTTNQTSSQSATTRVTAITTPTLAHPPRTSCTVMTDVTVVVPAMSHRWRNCVVNYASVPHNCTQCCRILYVYHIVFNISNLVRGLFIDHIIMRALRIPLPRQPTVMPQILGRNDHPEVRNFLLRRKASLLPHARKMHFTRNPWCLHRKSTGYQ